ncbi:hypothetical protein [Sphingomonas oryzagri]
MLDASLTPEIVGLEQLIRWIADHRPDLHDRMYARLYHTPISLIRGILQEAKERGEPVTEASVEAATLVYDATIAQPRSKILLRLGLENRKKAKLAHLEKILDLLLEGIAPTSRG